MTDDELLLATAKARGLAHRAPFAEIYEVNKNGKPTGEKHISNHTHAWAERGQDFSDLMNEVRRRGLSMPSCDCPPGSHTEAGAVFKAAHPRGESDPAVTLGCAAPATNSAES